MKHEPTDRELRPLGECVFKKVRYKDQWKIEVHWRDQRKSKDPRKQRCKRWADNPRAARQIAEEITKELEAAKGDTPHTFAEAADGLEKEWEQRMRAKVPTLGPITYSSYRRSLRRLARPKFDRWKLVSIKPQSVRDWLLELGQTYSPKTITGHLAVMHEVMKYAVRRDMISMNPCQLVEWPKTEARRDAPPQSDMEKLAEVMFGRPPANVSEFGWSCDRLIVAIGAICGLRAGEIAGLQWDDINQTTGEFSIKRSVKGYPTYTVGPTKTQAGLRRVPTTSILRQMLDEHAVLYNELYGKCIGHVIRPARTKGRLPVRTEFLGPQQISSHFIQFMRRAGVVDANGKTKFPLHALRHWMASVHGGSPGVNLHALKTWLGHKNAATTLNTYGHYIDRPDDRAKFEAVPTFLDRVVDERNALMAPANGSPLTVVDRPALPAPEPVAIEGDFAELPSDEWSILEEVPENADRWLKPFLRQLARCGNVSKALLEVGKTKRQLQAELGRCGLPGYKELEAIALRRIGEIAADGIELEEEPIAVAIEAPKPAPLWDIPAGAPPYLEPYVRCLDRGMTHGAACQAIRKDPDTVTAELRRWKMGDPLAIKKRLREKRIVELFEAGYQDRAIARILSKERGGKVSSLEVTVRAFRRERAFPNADTEVGVSKSLKGKSKMPTPPKADPRVSHKNQLKLL